MGILYPGWGHNWKIAEFFWSPSVWPKIFPFSGVPQTGTTPKSSIFTVFSTIIINNPFWGTPIPCMLYMVTFTINIPPMLAYIPYMDPMGCRKPPYLSHFCPTKSSHVHRLKGACQGLEQVIHAAVLPLQRLCRRDRYIYIYIYIIWSNHSWYMVIWHNQWYDIWSYIYIYVCICIYIYMYII